MSDNANMCGFKRTRLWDKQFVASEMESKYVVAHH